MSINIFDVEPIGTLNPVFDQRTNAFATWWSNLPDQPGSVTLRFGLLDSLPYSYTWSEGVGDMVMVRMEVTDLLRQTVIFDVDDMLTHPRADELLNEPGFFTAGYAAAIQNACLALFPMMQTQVLDELFRVVGWDAGEWLETHSERIGMEAACQYIIDKALTVIMCGPGETQLDPESPAFRNIEPEDVSWLQSIVSDAYARLAAVDPT